ncbi:carbohydrate kinase family protein [Streptomyces sp. NBC_01794]|uniref:carbohydrate kinase family protein n=1 Tax=Streptomyces sp. NBC_01794 TaxID=2975942 RepID=UPI003084EAF3|nr:carbohydrate kinase family protein [Streptomyces sp. NBC_01794]
MRLAITGSIATDHLATFPGRFADQLIPDQLSHISLSFLVDDLEVRRGGVAANIAFGLGLLGLTPYLVGAVGPDFDEYRIWLKEHGVDTEHVRVSSRSRTARFMCTTDQDQNQIASFYAGAMAEAAQIDLSVISGRTGGVDLVLVAPNTPEAMIRHRRQCEELGVPFAADPSQQLARLTRDEVRLLVTGALWLFTNDYEAALLSELSGWTREEILSRVGAWITTRGADGVTLATADGTEESFPAVPSAAVADPTGVGDAFRAGFLAGTSWGLAVDVAIPLGCAMATRALETVGSQQYTVSPTDLLTRISDTYGGQVGARLAPYLELSP